MGWWCVVLYLVRYYELNEFDLILKWRREEKSVSLETGLIEIWGYK